MAQLAGYSKNPLKINLFWEKASAEPPLDWSKRAAILEMAVFAKDGIEVRNLLRVKPPSVKHAEPSYEVEMSGETEAQRKKRDVRNQEKRDKSWTYTALTHDDTGEHFRHDQNCSF